MLIKVLMCSLSLILLVSCSVKVKEIETSDSQSFVFVIVSVLTDIPHASYEVKQIKNEIEKTYRSDTDYGRFRVCLSYTADTPSCKRMFPDYHAHVVVTIKDLAGIGDAGDVYGNRVEGKGYAKASVVIKDKAGKTLKQYELEGTARPEDTELARGVGEAVRKMARKVVTVSKNEIDAIVTASSSKTPI